MPTVLGGCVSKATPQDAERIARLHRDVFDKGWDADFVGDILRSPSGFGCLGFAKGSEPEIGFALARSAGDDFEILSFAIRNNMRRRGFGSALLTALIEIARSTGACRVILDVRNDNAAALKLYRGAGFQLNGRRKNYYKNSDGAQCDALLLTLALDECGQ